MKKFYTLLVCLSSFPLFACAQSTDELLAREYYKLAKDAYKNNDCVKIIEYFSIYKILMRNSNSNEQKSRIQSIDSAINFCEEKLYDDKKTHTMQFHGSVSRNDIDPNAQYATNNKAEAISEATAQNVNLPPYKNENSEHVGRLSKINKDYLQGGILEGKNPSDEIRDLRNEISKKYDLGGGIKQVVIGGPFHYLDANGAWQDIDLTIKKSSDGLYSYANEDNRFVSKFGKEHIYGVQMNYKNSIIQFGENISIYGDDMLPFVYDNIESVSTNENRIKYENIYQKVNLEYEISPKSVFHKMVFNDKNIFTNISGQRMLNIEEEIQLPVNAYLIDSIGIVNENRNVYGAMYVVVNNDTVFTILAAQICDASKGNSSVGNEKFMPDFKILTASVSIMTPNRIKYVAHIPVNWLLSSDRVYPLTFDPTVFSGTYFDGGSDASPYAYPWQTGYNQRASQILIRSSLIGISGNITAVGYMQNLNNGIVNQNATIKIKTTSTNALNTPTFDLSWSSPNFSGSLDFRSTGAGWHTETLSVPYTYTYSSGNNLLLESRFFNTTTSPHGDWYYVDAGYQAHRWGYDNLNNYPPANTFYSAVAAYYVPVLQLTISSCSPVTPSSCSASIGSPANGPQHHTNLSCSPVSGVDGYSFEYSFDNINWNFLASGTFFSYDVNNGDAPNIPVYYRVRTYCGGTYSGYRNSSVIYTACDDPIAPSLLNATCSSLDIAINSEPPVPNPSITTYALYCLTTSQYVQFDGSLGSSPYYQTRASWGFARITPLSSNTTYCFYAIAKNALGDIRYNPSNYTCLSTSSTPGGVTVSGGGTFCNNTTIFASGGSGGTIYYQGTISGGTSTSIPATSYPVTTSGTYYFRSRSSSGCWGAEGSVFVIINNGATANAGLPQVVCSSGTISLSGSIGGGASSSTWSAPSGSFSNPFSTTSSYTPSIGSGSVVLTLTTNDPDGAGPCTAATSGVTVTVNPTPSPVTVTGGGSSCGSATLIASGGSGGAIYFQGTTSGGTSTSLGTTPQSISVSGTYYFNARSSAVCWGTQGSAAVTITSSPLPISGSTNTCIGLSTTLNDATSGGVWSSSNTTVATIGSNTGIVTGVAFGTSVITYSVGSSCIAVTTFTVNNVSPIAGSSNVCEGMTTALTDATSGGTWTSTITSIATIDATSGVITGVSAGSTIITYSLGTGCTATKVVTVSVSPASISGITTVCVGAIATASDLTIGGTWSSANSSVAAIGSASGVVTGVSAGTSTISYTLPTGCTAIKVVTVNPLPATISGNNPVCAGSSISLTDVTTGGTWSSSNTAIADVGSTTGLITGVSSGTAAISYTLTTGCSSNIVTTINPLPSSITGSTTVGVGATTTLSNTITGGTWSSSNATIAAIGSGTGIVFGMGTGTAVITYILGTGCLATIGVTVNALSPITGLSSVCAGSSIPLSNSTGGGTWTSSNATIATVNPSSGIVTGIAPGTVNITYTVSSSFTTTVITVNALPAAIGGSLQVCPALATTLSDATGFGVWAISNATVATIGSGTGIVTGVSPGTAIVTYVLVTGCQTTATLTVNTPPSSITGSSNVCPGMTTWLNNITLFGAWSTSNSAVASIGAGTGLATGISPGTATISYTLSTGCFTTASLTVNPVPPAITGTTTMCIGSSTTLSNTASGTWSSSNSALATVNSGMGTVTGIAAGNPIITFTASTTGCFAVTTVTVNSSPSPITGVAALCQYGTSSLSDVSPFGEWTSSASTVASVGSGTGIVIGIAPGTSTITYTLVTGCTATTVITVNSLPSLISGASPICAGSTTVYSDSTAFGVWSPSNPAIASIGSGSGIVTGISPGDVTITYTLFTGCLRTTTLSVLPAPSAGAISGASSVCAGAYIILTDAVSGGTWSSSNSNASVISGVVTGVTAGTAVISYSVTNSCGTDVATKAVVVNPLPDAGSISGLSSVCESATITLPETVSGGIWASSNSNVSVTGGTVTGVTAGSSIISYTVTTSCGTAVATKSIVINPLPNAGTISGSTSVCVSASITLTDLVASGTWNSDNTSVATISSGGILTGVSAGAVLISYTVTTGCGTAVSTFSVTVNPLPNAGTISGPSSVCEAATITLSDPATGGVWSSSNAAIATVNSSGIVTGVGSGTTIISYVVTNGCGTAYANQMVTVNPLPVAGTISGSSNVCESATITLTDGASGGVWSSGNTSVATVSGGVVSGVLAGTATISYTVTNGCGAAFATLDVTVNPLPVAGSVSGSSSVCEGATITLTDGASGGVWTSSNTSVAAVSGGIVTGILAGTTTISYTVTNGCGTAYAIQIVTVNPLPVAGSISGSSSVCESATVTLTDGASSGVWTSSNTSVATISGGVVTGILAGTTTISYTVTNGCGTTAATLNVTVNPLPIAGSISGPSNIIAGSTATLISTASGGSWSSSTTSVATVSSSGIVTGVTNGTAIVSYTVINGCGTAVATYPITVNPAAGPILGVTSVCVGLNTSLTDDSTGGIWSSSNTSIASIGSASGIVAGISAGTAIISYIVFGSYVTTTITVNSLPATIGGSSAVCTGLSITLNDVTTGGTWASNNSLVAAIGSGTGVVTGVSAGTAAISYILSTGCYSTKAITVNVTPSAITGASTVCIASTITLSDGGSGVWSSGGTSIATVGSGTGIVTGVSAGMVPITYALGSCIATAMVTVNPLPEAISGAGSVCMGLTTTLSSSTSGGTWISSNTAVATVGTGIGVVTGVSAGTTGITYMLSTGCFTTSSVTVNPIAPISGATNVCVGLSVPLSNSVPGGVWSSGSASIAAVGSTTGIVTGISAGTSIVTYLLSSGCRATASITVNPVPSSISGGSSSVCPGATITLSDATTGGSWSSGNTTIASIGSGTGIVTGVSGGTVTMTYTLATGCLASKVVSVNPAPAAIAGSTNICVGATTTLSNTAAGGTWSSSNTGVATVGTTSGIVSGVANGTCTITYTLPCGIATITMNVGVPPTIISVSPYIGVPTATVTVTGTNFNSTASNNIVYFGATRATVTSATGTSLNVTVPIDATFNPISELNTGCNLVAYSQYPFLPTYNNSAYISTSITLNSNVDFASGTNPYNVAIGDIDGDGKADIVVANSGANTVSIFRNTATSGTITTGSLAAKVDFATGNAPGSVAITDFDKDGKADLVVANFSSNTVSVLRNTGVSGAISFATKVDFGLGTGAIHPNSVATGDIDGDGKQDIIVACQAAAKFSILRNTSTSGSITSSSFATKVDFTTGSQPFYVVVGDIDSDGKPDIAVVNNGSNSVSVFRNTATSGSITGSSLAARIDFATGTGPYSAAMGDINGDGKLDLIVVDATAQKISILRNTATSGSITSSSFATRVDFTTTVTPRFVVVGDLDGDTKPDIAVTNISVNTVSVFRNDPIPGRPSGSNVFDEQPTNIENSGDLIVIPNPNDGNFEIKGSFGYSDDEEVAIDVIDILGQIVYKKSIITQHKILDERIILNRGLASGAYILSIRSATDKRVFHLTVGH